MTRCHQIVFKPAGTAPQAEPEMDSPYCIGARCPLWVPEMTVTDGAGKLRTGLQARRLEVVAVAGFSFSLTTTELPGKALTGRGVCRDNPDATPYDPDATPFAAPEAPAATHEEP